ncbi:camp-dependent protein kinase 3 [Backusella circina FSU 941]|nr:camp-dependent protein kinase 3 [Backusella circina FSU 941]
MDTPRYTPRSSDEIHQYERDIKGKSTSSQPIFTHKLPDDFFTSCSPPSPIAPFKLFSSNNNTPCASPCTSPRLKPLSELKTADINITTTATTTTIPNINTENAPFNDTLPKGTIAEMYIKPSERIINIKKNRVKLSLDDFIIKETIGTGSFARVHLTQCKKDEKFYAIKAISKKDLVTKRQVEHGNNEREIMSLVSHPFLVNLHGTFQTESHVFLVMDYVPGGELFRVIKHFKILKEEDAKFYAAQVTLAIEYLHNLDITYRDLKPENILIDEFGYIKVTDFGFAKKVTDITWTVCGTPDYLAPEIIRSQGYNKAVDWWSLGVLIFEMLTGHPPFVAKNPVDQYQKILECDMTFPDDISPEAKDLMQNLLKTKPSERLGNLKDGAADIKNHPWFKTIDFDKLFKREGQVPPFVPDIKFVGDTHCFAFYEEPHLAYNMMHTDESYCNHFSYF